ncbi:UNVERIFIED_CONTAM: hypothetical protein RMT77_007937 [Armadillidium vulgare]
MGRSSNKGTGKESDAEAREEIARHTKRNLFILKKDFKIALNKLSKVISKGKIALIQGEKTDQLKQTVKELEQELEEAEAKLQVYVNNMEILEMFDDIKEEEMLEITQSEAQKVRVQIYTLIARQERENDAADSSEVREYILKSTNETASSFVPRSSNSSSEIVSSCVSHSSKSSRETASIFVPRSSKSSSEVTSGSVPHSSEVTSGSVPHSSKYSNEVTSGSVPHSSKSSSEVTSGSVPHSSKSSSEVTSAGTATEEVFVETQSRSEDKMKMKLENQNEGLVRDLENTKVLLNDKENLLQEKVTIIKELEESKQMLESKVEDILKCKENDRLLNERQHEELKQQRLLERQSLEALLNGKERDKRNLLDIIQEKEETEQKMASFIKERELEIKNLHALNESEKRNLREEISEANSEIQRLRELLTKRDQVILKAMKENEDSIKEGQDADAEHSNEEPFLISKLENERAEVLPQIKNNKESIQAKLERFQEKGKREFSKMDKERQKTKVQLGKKRGALIKGRMKKRVHFEKLKKEGKERTFIKNENTRNNWRLALARRAFIGQVRRVKRAWLRLGKRNLGNHRKRKRRSVHPVVLSVPRGTGDPHQGAIFNSKLSQFRRSHVAAFVKAEEVSREILSMSHYRLASFPSSRHFSH